MAVTALSGVVETEPPPVRLVGKVALGAGAYVLTLLPADHWIRKNLFAMVKCMRCAFGGVS